MGVGIEKGHLKICGDLTKEVNRLIRHFSPKSYRINPAKYESLLERKNLTISDKKKKLLNTLHSIIVHTLSIDVHKLRSKERILDDLRLNIRLARAVIFKLRNLNYYLDEVFLPEIGIKKKTKDWEKILKQGPKKSSKEWLDKHDFARLEHTIHDMIGRVITLDEKLLKKYRKKEAKIIKDEAVKITDLEGIYGKESELLMHLEAKLPPPNKVKAELLGPKKFTHWASRILSALTGIEHLSEKESKIFQKLKQSRKLRKKITSRIDYVLREKMGLMDIKEQRALSWEHMGKVDNALHEAAHKYLAASQL